ncbi:stabilizer of axonemal microtubules 5 [Anolis sagrei]|uniref:stabilizer of axonemal microtubules 5 n=1 Tax=Anolis sagrei TaxID=38937 RepID=UPI003520F9C1
MAQVPSPLPMEAFLRASHFRLGHDLRPGGFPSSLTSRFREDFPPRWGTFRPPPARLPPSVDVLNQDMGPPWDTQSQAVLSFPPRPIQPRPEIRLPVTQPWMHADPLLPTPDSLTHWSYPCPYSEPWPAPVQRKVDKWEDSLPRGDKEKLPLPPSLTQESFREHLGAEAPTKAPSLHLGKDSALKGDGRYYYETSYKSQYTGQRGPPAKPYKEIMDSIAFGDPRCHEMESEQKQAFTPWPPGGQRYDPTVAVAKIFQTNVQPGDGRHSFSTISSEAYKWKKPGPLFVHNVIFNESNIQQGDREPGRNPEPISSHQFYFQKPKAGTQVFPSFRAPEKPLPLCLGDPHLPASFTTTHTSDYMPPADEAHKVPSAKGNLRRSNIPFNYYPSRPPSTSTQDMLAPHPLQKPHLTQEEIQRLRRSHLVHPWQGQRWFSTETKEQFRDKYSGPIVLATGDFQKTSLPLGTMDTYLPRPKRPG